MKKLSVKQRAKIIISALTNVDWKVLGSREYYSCLEMGDADNVLRDVVKAIPSFYALHVISQGYCCKSWWDEYRQ